MCKHKNMNVFEAFARGASTFSQQSPLVTQQVDVHPERGGGITGFFCLFEPNLIPTSARSGHFVGQPMT